MTNWNYTLTCIGFWGIAAVLMKYAAKEIGPFSAVVTNTIGYIIVAAVMLPRANLSASWAHAAGIAIGILFPIGNFFFYKLTQTGEVSRFAPLTTLYVAVPVVFGVLLFGESLSSRKFMGIILAMSALWLLNSN